MTGVDPADSDALGAVITSDGDGLNENDSKNDRNLNNSLADGMAELMNETDFKHPENSSQLSKTLEIETKADSVKEFEMSKMVRAQILDSTIN
jgi:pyruvoyl-dependent arginine decarboxylase (PvlArgDC)